MRVNFPGLLIEGLLMSYGFNCILVVVDRLSLFSHFILLKHSFTAVNVAEHLLRKLFVYMGCQLPLCQIRIKFSQAHSSENCFNCRAPPYR